MHRNIIVFYKLTNFTNLFLSSNFKNNDKVILNYYFWIETNKRIVGIPINRKINIHPQLDNRMELRFHDINRIAEFELQNRNSE